MMTATSLRWLKISQRFISRKPRYNEEELLERFVDQRRMTLVAGSGGNGASVFHRDRISAFGGPSGGSGGRGGDVVLRADRKVTSLSMVNKYYRAKKGGDGRSKFYNGKSAPPLVVNIPIGTRLICDETADVLCEFRRDGETYVACAGGIGGKGNMFFKSSTNTQPKECTAGEEGERRIISAEMLLIAHAGLVGFPNAGKSTLLRALSRAKPKIAEYAFTTLTPHVGVVHYDDFVNLSVADLPGLVEGAHRNEGLGFAFLRHVERCRFLVYVCDLSHREPWLQVDKLERELRLYDASLPARVRLVVANKLDLATARDNYRRFRDEMRRRRPDVHVVPLSGADKTNLEAVIDALRQVYDRSGSSDFDRETPWWDFDPSSR